MSGKKDLSRLFAKGQQLESYLTTPSIFSKDGGLHLTSYKVSATGKTTVIDNISIYGNTLIVIESKNYREIRGEIVNGFWRGKGTRHYFSTLNPIRQNEYHSKVLRLYLEEKEVSRAEANILHYVVVPDTCKIDVCEESRKNLIHQSELETVKRRMAFYHPEIDMNIAEVIKEGLF